MATRAVLPFLQQIQTQVSVFAYVRPMVDATAQSGANRKNTALSSCRNAPL
jgi:hypothetical protein